MIDKVKYEIHKSSGTLERYRGNLVAAELNKRGYDINYQIAIGFDKDTKPVEYAAYQRVRAECKDIVDGWFAEMEININNHGA